MNAIIIRDNMKCVRFHVRTTYAHALTSTYAVFPVSGYKLSQYPLSVRRPDEVRFATPAHDCHSMVEACFNGPRWRCSGIVLRNLTTGRHVIVMKANNMQ